jgi:hypothetical protein
VYEYAAIGGNYRLGSMNDISNAGQVAGFSNRYATDGTYLGTDGWVYNGTTTVQIGLFGAGYEYQPSPGQTYREGGAGFVNTAGHVAGGSSRFGADGTYLGQDAWFYNGSTTQRINLSGGAYEYPTPAGSYRFGQEWLIKSSDVVVGYNSRFDAAGGNLGNDIWLFDGATRLLNLTGGPYETAAHLRVSTMIAVNDVGEVLGTSERYAGDGSSLGLAGWFFDHSTDATTALEFSFRNDGFCETDPQFLTEDGIVLGSYERFSGATSLGDFAFWWSRDAGFHDLGNLVSGGLSLSGWSALADVIDAQGAFLGGSPRYIAGVGLASDQTYGSSGYLLAAKVPEPACAGIAGLVLLGLRRRSRDKRSTSATPLTLKRICKSHPPR